VSDIHEEHLDEAAFLHAQWERSLLSPVLTLADVARTIEPRLFAHLDGLVLGGAPVAEGLLIPMLADGDPDQCFAAAWSLFHAEDADRSEPVFAALAGDDEALAGAVERAIALAASDEALAPLGKLFGADDPQQRAAAVRIAGARDVLRAELDRALPRLVSDPEPAVRAAVLRTAARGLAGAAFRGDIVRALRSDDAQLRGAAVEAGLLGGVREAWNACRDVVTSRGPGAETALLALGVAGSEADQGLVLSAAQTPALGRAATRALGYVGTVDAAELCLGLMRKQPLAKLAGEAFVAITGLDMRGEALYLIVEGDPIDDDEPGEEAAAIDPAEEALLLPNAHAIADWWAGARAAFPRGVRYRGGRPLEPASLADALETSPMRQRPGLCFEIALRTDPSLSIDARSWTHRQRADVARARSAAIANPQRPASSRWHG
jgi:uncharacterized protein (TIGR02270 family)